MNMNMKKELDTVCDTCKSAKKGLRNCIDFIDGISIKSKADIGMTVKSKRKVKPLWGFQLNCDKEIKLWPIIGIVLGVMLIATLLSDMCCCGKDD